MKTGWKMKPFEECIEKVNYTQKIQQKNFLKFGTYPVVSQEEDFINGYWDNEADLFKVTTPIVVFGDHTKVLKYVDFDFVLGADGVKLLQSLDFLLPKFFFYQLQTANLDSLGYARHYKLLKELKIAYPPLPEQKRIVAILTEQMAAVEKAQVAAETRLKAAKELPASYLREVFKSEKTQGWHTIALGDAGKVVSGVTLGSKIKKVKVRAVPYLRVANVKDGHLDLNDVKTIEVTENEIQRWRLQAGDLLLTEGGDPDKLGRGSFWNDEIPECIHQNHIFRVRFPQDRFLPEFLSAQMSSEYGKSYFLAHAKQTTGIATINQKVLKAFPLLVPPIKEQMEIAEAISSKISTANQICTMLFEELTTINKLPAALLRQAFAGEL